MVKTWLVILLSEVFFAIFLKRGAILEFKSRRRSYQMALSICGGPSGMHSDLLHDWANR